MNDNFPNLWASFRAQVQAARGEREAIYTDGENVMTQRYGARVSIWDPALYETPTTSVVDICKRHEALRFRVQQSDLVAIAAQCMAVAEQMGELPIAEGFNAQAHGHLITDTDN